MFHHVYFDITDNFLIGRKDNNYLNKKYLQPSVSILDPSDVYRPDISTYADKDVKDFRTYVVDETDPIKDRVYQTYKAMHTNQTVDFVQGRYTIFRTNSLK